MPNSRYTDIFEKLSLNSVFDYRFYNEPEQMITVKGLRRLLSEMYPC